MKGLLVLLLLATTAHAADNEFISEQRISSESNLVEIPEGGMNKGSVDPERMYDYKTDSCNYRDNSITNEDELREQHMRRCADGSVSFVQPPSEGWRGWEGKCGQTAASNILFMFCRVAAHPKRYSDYYLEDLTPGVRPGVLASGLDDMFERNYSNCPNGNWETVTRRNSRDYYNLIDRTLRNTSSNARVFMRTRDDGTRIQRSPLAALIRPPQGKSLHWVTIVDLLNKGTDSCKVVINHWDDQFEVPCYTFARWSYGVWDSFGPVLQAYTLVTFD